MRTLRWTHPLTGGTHRPFRSCFRLLSERLEVLDTTAQCERIYPFILFF